LVASTISGAHETLRGALALVSRRKLLHQIRGSIQRPSGCKLMIVYQNSQILG
jgi:hypothetical protein